MKKVSYISIMRILILAIAFSCIYIYSNAQDYAIIKDKDGYVNVRQGPNFKSKIIGKLYTDDIFGYDSESETAGWIKIYKQNNKVEINSIDGYIDKTRLLPLSQFKSLNKKQIGKHIAIVSNDSISITINSSAFIAKNHKLHHYGIDKLLSIDEKHVWGTDGEVPKVKISAVNVSINNISITIPKSEFDDLYEPNFKDFNVYLSKNGTLYIEMDNSDGAGAYTIIWVIKNNQYLKRYIDNSNV
jgi:hypothetical protein